MYINFIHGATYITFLIVQLLGFLNKTSRGRARRQTSYLAQIGGKARPPTSYLVPIGGKALPPTSYQVPIGGKARPPTSYRAPIGGKVRHPISYLAPIGDKARPPTFSLIPTSDKVPHPQSCWAARGGDRCQTKELTQTLSGPWREKEGGVVGGSIWLFNLILFNKL